MKQLSLKEAHAIACSLQREISTLKSDASLSTLHVMPNSVPSIAGHMEAQYNKTIAAYQKIFAYESLYLSLRKSIGDMNYQEIPFLKSTNIRSLIEEQLARKTASASLKSLMDTLGIVSEEEIANANRVLTSATPASTYLRGAATQEQRDELQKRLNGLKSATAKTNLVIDKANAVMSVTISNEDFTSLEALGLA